MHVSSASIDLDPLLVAAAACIGWMLGWRLLEMHAASVVRERVQRALRDARKR
ncbi:MAG: hypothetical protein NZ898_13925 [Myxococcota bacterium]|nr:hypothetical protein [Myxococcota bacterium]MDW8363697.1 hypothetical protein [Myxococcales bacterium]